MKIPMTVKGFFRLQVMRADGTKRLDTGWFANLITNGGLDQLGAGGYLTSCFVGTGNTAPVNANTALVAQVGSTSSIISSTAQVLPSTPYYGSRVNTYNFPAGTATGVIAELGVGAIGTALFSRALVKDGSGNPTTVTVTAGEFLNVLYELRIYPPLSDVTGSVTISGTAYNFTARAANVGSSINWAPSQLGDAGGPQSLTIFSGGISDVTGGPVGASAPETSGVEGTYTGGSFFNTRNSTFQIGAGNFGGVESFLAIMGQQNGAFGEMQVGLSAPIPKDNTHALSLTMSQSWTRGPV